MNLNLNAVTTFEFECVRKAWEMIMAIIILLGSCSCSCSTGTALRDVTSIILCWKQTDGTNVEAIYLDLLYWDETGNGKWMRWMLFPLLSQIKDLCNVMGATCNLRDVVSCARDEWSKKIFGFPRL